MMLTLRQTASGQALVPERLLAGFFTEEFREHGQRIGFEAVGLSGQRSILAHVGIKSKHRVAGAKPPGCEFSRVVPTIFIFRQLLRPPSATR